jgi:hypothetical protein
VDTKKQVEASLRLVHDRLAQIDLLRADWDKKERELEAELETRRETFQTFKETNLDLLRDEKATLYQELSVLRCWVKPEDTLVDAITGEIITVTTVHIHTHTALDAEPIFSINYSAFGSASTTLMNVQNKDLKKMFKKVVP